MYHTLQGLLASFTDNASIGQVYSIFVLIDLVGRLLGSIAFAQFYQTGLGIPLVRFAFRKQRDDIASAYRSF